MKNRLVSCFFLTALLTLAANLAAAQSTVFGPEKYLRGAAKPQRIVKTFPASNTGSTFTLTVQNGEGKRGRVSSAVVELNGVPVLSPNAFSKQVDVVSKTVTLKASNELAVEVRSQPGTSVIVSITGDSTEPPPPPPPSPVSGVTATPDGFPVNTSTQVSFTAKIPYSGIAPSVELQRVSQAGDLIGSEGAMVDNGSLSLGDEIQGDGVFSLRKTYSLATPGDVFLRVKADVNGQVFYSNVFSLTAFTPVSDAEADTINTTLASAEQLYYQRLPIVGKDQALADVVAFLKAQSFVQDAGISEGKVSVWVTYRNGMDGGILFNPPGTRGGPAGTAPAPSTGAAPAASEPTLVQAALANPANSEVQSKKVLIMSPFLDQFAPDDEGAELKALYDAQNCPTYDGINGKAVYLSNSQVGVEAFKALGGYGIVHIATHGGIISNQVVFLTKASNSASNLKTYQTDILKKRLTVVMMGSSGFLAITPAFVNYYVQPMPSSLVFFSACLSTGNNTMSNAFLAKGAKTFFGFSNFVPSNFAYSTAKSFHKSWVEDPSNLVTTGEVFGSGGCSMGACWNLVGDSNLEAPSDGLQNGGFESGNLGAWTGAGDGRVLSQLGQFSPVEKSYFGLVSTGLGFTTSSGSVEQKTCIPATAQKLEFRWNFNSEEFVEWCGSAYQDTFTVDVLTDSGTQTLFSRKVDDLCGMVSPSNLKFDQSQGSCIPDSGNDCTVWSTDWQAASIDISAIAAANKDKTVTLRFKAGDVGDSIFDSAILIDDIKVITPPSP